MLGCWQQACKTSKNTNGLYNRGVERKTKNEKFHFTEAYLLSNLNINKFKSAVESDKLKIDIRIGVYRSGKNKGKYHDHGTGFRINKRDFLHLFDNFTKII